MATGEDIVEVGTYTAAVHVPKAGELVSAATLKAPLQALANRTKQMHNPVEVLRGYIGSQRFPFVSCDNSLTAQWKFDKIWTQALVSGGNRPIVAPIYLPWGTVVTRIRVNVKGVGHGGSRPSNMPSIEFFSTTASSVTSILTASDASPDAPNYDSPHAIDSGTISATLASDSTYGVQLYGEAGANAQPDGLVIYDLLVNFTPIA